MTLERLSKLAVIASALAALAGETYLGARGWPPLVLLTAGVFAGAFVLARVVPPAAWVPVLLATYIFPALFVWLVGRFEDSFHVVWFAGILGATLAAIRIDRWDLPASWRIPLAFWATIIAVTWPLVVAREADFSFEPLRAFPAGRLSNSGIGGPPALAAIWILNVSLTHMVGLLWCEWATRWLPSGAPAANDDVAQRRRQFSWMIVVPLVLSVVAASALAFYQGFVDMQFLNGHQWPLLLRAAGGLEDGDAAGVISAIWMIVVVAAGFRSWWMMLLALAISAVCWGGFWATGSRMALMTGFGGVAFFAWAGFRWLWAKRSAAGGIIAVILLIALVVAGIGIARSGVSEKFESRSPLTRVIADLPEFSRAGLAAFARRNFFDRGAPYGSASVLMFTASPLVGIGVGTFHQMFPDYSYVAAGVRELFDNAQSWYRHQLAELGLLGSLGWMIWTALMARLFITTRGDDGQQTLAAGIKWTLLMVAGMSLVSMPTQSAPVSLTVWVLTAWYLLLSRTAREQVQSQWLIRKRVWTVVWSLAIVVAGLTAWVGWTKFRPPYRAIMADWTYERGLHRYPGDVDEGFRWTGKESVIVLPITDQYLKLTFWIRHPDAASRPVEVTFWRQGRRIARVTLTSSAPVTWYVRAPAGRRMMMETRVSRTWRPVDYGEKDGRELGVAIANASFVAEPPRGSAVIQ